MATHTIVTLTDDLDGGPATATIRFAIDTESYEIDLNEKNEKEFRDALEPYVAAGRKRFVPRTRAQGPGPGNWGNALGKKKAKEIRAWGNAHGWEVGRYGRVPKEVVDAYWQDNPGA